jgi:hypothetical protein
MARRLQQQRQGWLQRRQQQHQLLPVVLLLLLLEVLLQRPEACVTMPHAPQVPRSSSGFDPTT